MKKIYSILSLLFLGMMIACTQEDDTALKSDTGYLRLAVSTVSSTTTKTGVPENYNPKQLYVEILDAAGKVVESTDDFSTDWTGKQFELKAGTYTIKASSNGFDGSVADFDIPYYAGETTVTVVKDKEVTASVVCKLANVKVTVNFDSSFSKAFKSAEASVSSFLEGVSPLSFTMGVEKGAAYFPEGNLVATIRVVNFDGGAFVQRDTIKNVKANDHYILNYQVKLEGEGDIKIEVDETERVYSITFGVNPNPTTTLEVDYPEDYNLWSTFAHVTGKVATKENESDTFDSSLMFFEYKQVSEDDWKQVLVTDNGDETYKGTLKNLTPNTAYSYRLAYRAGSEEYISGERVFTTEEATVLPAGDMENWTKDGKTIDLDNGTFWDSSNPGTTTGAGALVNANPTQGVTSPVHGGSKAAELRSQFASAVGIGKFAAASLYAGKFNDLVGTKGAKLDWGRTFTARPTQLKGWYQYTTGKVDYDGDGPLSGSDYDLWSAQIVLVDLGSANYVQVDNTDMSTFPDWTTDSRTVAYGALSDDICKLQKTSWTEFIVDLKYKSLTRKPTHIIIVFSSSKYGDYFEGSTSSLLYLDDLELIYGNNPQMME